MKQTTVRVVAYSPADHRSFDDQINDAIDDVEAKGFEIVDVKYTEYHVPRAKDDPGNDYEMTVVLVAQRESPTE